MSKAAVVSRFMILAQSDSGALPHLLRDGPHTAGARDAPLGAISRNVIKRDEISRAHRGDTGIE